MDNPFKSPNVLSLCPGMLGLERGVERAYRTLGWCPPKTIAYVEIEAFIIENLVKQMEKGVLAPAPIWSNLKTFRWELLRGKVDWFFGGYPCQPFSVSGAQKGEEDSRHLFPYIAKGIDIIRPRGCFFENVSNHFNIGYETVRIKLQDMGYRVEEGLYSAEEVGAPHKRERMFILAILGNTPKSNEQRYGLCKEYAQGKVGGPGSELANSDGERMRESCKKFESEQLRSDGIERRIKLADTNSEGSQKRGKQNARKELAATERICEPGMRPARRGNPQKEWERPRTVKSGMGTTINGYNFREDLLRMAGNGVVEQTAELAFIDLIRKHGLAPSLTTEGN